MNKPLIVTIPTSTKNNLIGKILVIIISSGLLGYWYSLDSAEKFETNKQLTIEQYTANFSQHKAKLLSPGRMPIPLGIFTMLIVFAGFFGLYELLGLLLGLTIGKIFTPQESSRDRE
ncbi:MAG: hypothetical protein WA828_17695 [Coleofasciculaceae cyanobacterium]